MTNTPDTNQGASAHSPTPTALDKQVASLHELYGRLHENIEQFQAGWITADEYSRRHGILSEAISEVRADGIDLVAYGLDPTIGSSNPPKSPDTPDQVDALDEILIDLHDKNDCKDCDVVIAEAKAKLSALLVEARIDELIRIDRIIGLRKSELDDPYNGHNTHQRRIEKAVADRIKHLKELQDARNK